MRGIWMLLLLVLCQWSYATPVVKVQQDTTKIALGQYLEYLIEGDVALSLEQVQSHTDWQRSTQVVPNFSFTPDTYWFRTQIEVEPDTPELILELSYPMLDSAEVFVVIEGKSVHQYKAGVTYPFSQRPIAHNLYLFPLLFENRSSATLYIRANSNYALQLPLVIWSQAAYWQHDRMQMGIQGLYFGIVSVMMLYNLFLYLSLRVKAYLYYVAVIGSIAMFQMIIHGFAQTYLWPDSHLLNTKGIVVFIGLAGGTFMQFCMAFLPTKDDLPRLYLSQKIAMYVSYASALLALVIPIEISMPAITVQAMIVSTNGVLLIIATWSRDRSAKFFCVAWITFLVGTLLMGLNKMAILDFNAITQGSQQFGSAIEAVLLSLALGERIKRLETEKSKAHQQALEMQHREQLAISENADKSAFLASMSHEIRTPMSGVLGIADLLKDTPLNAQQKDYLNTLYNSGQSLLTIINDILDYSKFEAGHIELETIDFDLEYLLDETVGLLHPRVKNKNVELIASLAPDVPAAVRGDPTRIRQILTNLLGNAIKFTDTGYVYLNISLAEKEASSDGVNLRVDVIDTGIGMNPEQIEKLFQRYTQAHSGVTRKYGGTGLGLVICKRLVEAMGGEIHIISTPGKGSDFWFTLKLAAAQEAFDPPTKITGETLLLCNSRPFTPLLSSVLTRVGLGPLHTAACSSLQSLSDNELYAKEIIVLYCTGDRQEMVATLQQLEQRGFAEKALVIIPDTAKLSSHPAMRHVQFPLSPYRLRKAFESGNYVLQPTAEAPPSMPLKVLLAEDNPVNQMVIKGLLSRYGIKPVLAQNGKEALEQIQHAQEPFDLVLMDCEMPEMDGFMATDAIHAWEAARHRSPTPIVALTAHVMQEYVEKAAAAGMEAHLSKPIDRAAFETLLKYYWERNQISAANQEA